MQGQKLKKPMDLQVCQAAERPSLRLHLARCSYVFPYNPSYTARLVAQAAGFAVSEWFRGQRGPGFAASFLAGVLGWTSELSGWRLDSPPRLGLLSDVLLIRLLKWTMGQSAKSRRLQRNQPELPTA